jgi:trans-aconitate methyltransferase
VFNRFFSPPSSLVGLWSQRALGYSVLLLPRVCRRAFVRALLKGEAGARWARFYLHASGEIDYSQPKYRALDALLTGMTGRVQWIGCCSGREVAWFAARHPSLTFHASDLSASAIDLCRATYHLPNLRFDVQDVTTATFGDDLVVSFGVLAYLDGPQIAQTARRVTRALCRGALTLALAGHRDDVCRADGVVPPV